MKLTNKKWSLLASGLLMMFTFTTAQAVPSFARQTGMACATCHRADYPELTAFGRSFKLNGYTLSGAKQIEASSELNKRGLKIDAPAPLSAMLISSITNTATPTETDAQPTAIGFPQELSLFYAGEMSPNMGTFLQMTYEQESDHFSWDNADVRYASHTDGGTTWGITFNNSPTVQDLWNSTPTWGFPYSGPAVANEPANSTLLDGALAQDSAGLGAYAMWNNSLYTELTMYKSAHLGSTQPSATTDNTLKTFSPYWRVAWDNNMGDSDLMVGAYGMMASIYDSGTTGSTVDYNDVGIDTQYQSKSMSVHASYTTETRKLNASGTGSPALNTLKLDGTYFMGEKSAATLSYFDTSGDTNAVWGTANNSPDSNGMIAQLSYLPWQNTKFSAQYRIYGKFDGTSTNAADNNSLALIAWLMW
jgi:hypothetical protein